MQIVDFAGVKVDNVALDEAVARAEEFIASGGQHLIVTPNPEIIVTAQNDRELREIINGADLRVPDGISMVVVSRLLGKPLKERVSGIDLMLKLIEASAQKGRKIFLFGGAPGVAEEAAEHIKRRFSLINIAGTHHGYEGDDSVVIKTIKEARPDILFVGLGGGRQERWLNRHLKESGVKVGMSIGGSLDVISGRKKRAPAWIQKLNIEWLYRLLTEPDRWRRQLALPKFLWLMFTQNK